VQHSQAKLESEVHMICHMASNRYHKKWS